MLRSLTRFRRIGSRMCSDMLLATGRQPGSFSENSYGKSYIKVWILKRGFLEPGRGWLPLYPPFKIQIFIHMNFPKKCPVAFQWPSGFGPSGLCTPYLLFGNDFVLSRYCGRIFFLRVSRSFSNLPEPSNQSLNPSC